MAEEWRQISGHAGYEVSNYGRIRGVARAVPCGDRLGVRLVPCRILKPVRLTTGYLQVCLHRKKILVHRVVAVAFCDGARPWLQVNHKDGDKQGNASVNLEWVTSSENHNHAYAELGRIAPWSGKSSGLHSTSKAVVSVDMETGAVIRYESASDAVREGFDSGCISRCCAGTSGYHKGRKWAYAYGAEHGVVWTEPETLV